MSNLISQSLFSFEPTLEDEAQAAIELLRQHEAKALELQPDHGYWLAFSGGKDSCVIKQIAIEAGIKCRMVYNATTIDPPELVRFIKQHHKDVEYSLPKRNFFKALVDSHGMPIRQVRWCCEEFKERHGAGIKIFGVRTAESFRRKKIWKPITPFRDNELEYAVCPIVYWSDADVWQFIKLRNIPYCDLYNEGWKRLGCIGCPMTTTKMRKREFARWPGFEKAWRTACDKYFQKRIGKLNRYGKPYFIEKFKNSTEFFEWWLSDQPSKKDNDEPCLGLY